MRYAVVQHVTVWAVLLAGITRSAAAADTSGTCCQSCGAPCPGGHLVPKTIKVPIKVTETRLQPCVVKTIQEREETYTVFQRVPVTQKFMKETCYLDTEVHSKEVTVTKCRRVTNPVVRTYAVNVPETEYKEGVRRICCPKCGQCGEKCCCAVEEPCVYPETRMHKELRSETCERPDVAFEKCTRQIDYCVKVPKKHEEFCAEEVVYKLVPVQKTRTVQVCVPEIVKKPVDVCVEKMVCKTIWCCEKCCAK